MIKLPDFNRPFFYENSFYLTCSNQRINKILSCYELFKKTLNIPGAIVECGIFKGISLIRWASFRDMFSEPSAKKIIGFDIFGEYPEATLPEDKLHRKCFIDASGESISKEQLLSILSLKGITNVELIEGDILKTVPCYIEQHPELKISLLYLDCTLYAPTFSTLKYFYEKLVLDGLLILNGYSKEGILGETRAVDEFFGKMRVVIQKLPFSYSPCYIVKGKEKVDIPHD